MLTPLRLATGVACCDGGTVGEERVREYVRTNVELKTMGLLTASLVRFLQQRRAAGGAGLAGVGLGLAMGVGAGGAAGGVSGGVFRPGPSPTAAGARGLRASATPLGAAGAAACEGAEGMGMGRGMGPCVGDLGVAVDVEEEDGFPAFPPQVVSSPMGSEASGRGGACGWASDRLRAADAFEAVTSQQQLQQQPGGLGRGGDGGDGDGDGYGCGFDDGGVVLVRDDGPSAARPTSAALRWNPEYHHPRR